MRFSTTLVSAAAFFELCIAGYVLEDDYMTDFYGNFNFFTGADPTEGFVKYVDEATARKSNLINASSTTAAQFGVDVTNKTPNGRPSIRIESKKKYDSGLIVLDVAHMPFGCGTWPAFWTLGPNWPKGGEIDILEGVNEFTNNGMTLHTSPGCQIGSDTTQFSGSVTTGNCDVAADGQLKNAGCSIAHPSKQSYGAGLNQAGGGVYATAWNSDGISIFFFPRDSVPADALGDNPNPEAWGKPAAKFAGACDIEKMFAEQQIIIDTTFCGAWAGAAWEDGSCAKKAKTCDEYVRDNPEAFTEAYWEINALKVYQDNGKAPAAPSPPAYTPKSTAVSVPVPVSTRSPVAAPPLSSQVAPPNSSVLVPVPVSTKSPVAAPPLSSQVAPPNSSVLVPGVPSKPSVTPIVQIPSSKAPAASGVPSPGPQSSRTRGGPGSARPSKPVNTQINAAPTGAQGMPGWSWPSAGDNGGEDSQVAPPSNGSNTPAENSSGVAALPSSRPSNIPAPPARPSVKPPPVPNVPAEENAAPVRTVYQTVYLTKTAAVGAAATPAPEEKHARMARHIQLHRRRWTQQHAHI